jgi:hypothetical protein
VPGTCGELSSAGRPTNVILAVVGNHQKQEPAKEKDIPTEG